MNGLYLALVVCGVCAWVWWSPWLAARRRARAATSEFPVEWQALLEAELPLYLHLPAPLRERLNRRMLQFLAGRRFIGCDGLVVTPEMPVLIAAQAAVLALGPEPDPWPELQTILIYPGAFLSPHVITHEDGVVEEELRELEGESWSGDRVVLAWEEVEFGASDPHDGINVVVHEFAHQLDLLNEGTGGLPRLPQGMAIETWTRAWSAAFDEHASDVARGRTTWLDPAAAELPGEFFAYVVEHFIESPWELKARWPEIYQLLQQVLAIDPLGWECSASG